MQPELKILIIEDDRSSVALLSSVFSTNGFNISVSENGKKAIYEIQNHFPDIAILDLGLPDIDGLKLLNKIRSFTDMPVIVLSARNSEADKVTALETGADDYITKPFSSAELIARINNAVRHNPSLCKKENYIFRYKNLIINYRTKQVSVDGCSIHLTTNEYNILSLLARNSGKTITYDSIIKNIWGQNPDGNTGILRVNMANIRRKIEIDTSNPEYIITETGIGYRMPGK